MPLFLFLFDIFSALIINSITLVKTFIRRNLKRSLFISPLLGGLSGKTSLGCQAENSTRSCLSASRRTTSWAMPHSNWATPQPIELRRTPYWTVPHPNWDTGGALLANTGEASTGHTQRRKNIEREKEGWHQAYIVYMLAGGGGAGGRQYQRQQRSVHCILQNGALSYEGICEGVTGFDLMILSMYA